MAKIKTLCTVPGSNEMIPRGALLTIGKDVKDTVAASWLKSGYAEPFVEPANPQKRDTGK